LRKLNNQRNGNRFGTRRLDRLAAFRKLFDPFSIAALVDKAAASPTIVGMVSPVGIEPTTL